MTAIAVARGKRVGGERRALAILANAKARGCTAATLLAHGFKIEMLAGLVRDGYATACPEVVKADGRTTEVARVRITDVGRRALDVR
jgi:acyl-coenzyme A thioesterase PaaI-like protein